MLSALDRKWQTAVAAVQYGVVTNDQITGQLSLMTIQSLYASDFVRVLLKSSFVSAEDFCRCSNCFSVCDAQFHLCSGLCNCDDIFFNHHVIIHNVLSDLGHRSSLHAILSSRSSSAL